MLIAIVVHGAPFASQASGTALRFVFAALTAGHHVPRVFFFHEGVLTANGLSVPPQDEHLPEPGWGALAEEHGIELAVCIATALKRGIVDAQEQARYGLAGASLHPAFTLVGLGQLIDAMNDCDRLVTFSS